MTNPNPDRARAYHLKVKYGITPEQYQELFDRQEGLCVICRRHQDELPQRLAVDHNHKTLEIRGLLCSHCNHRVVGRHTDHEVMRRVADYLAQGTGWFVPPKKRKPRARKK